MRSLLIIAGSCLCAVTLSGCDTQCKQELQADRIKLHLEQVAHEECKGNATELHHQLGSCNRNIGKCNEQRSEVLSDLNQQLDDCRASFNFQPEAPMVDDYDDNRSWHQYDAIFDVRSLSKDRSIEWPVYSAGDALDEVRRDSPLICITGKFNSGKSFLASKLYGVSLPVGDTVPTVGLSVACLQVPNQPYQDCLIDSQGFSTPVGPDDRGERLHEKLLQDLQTDICLQSADMAIWVVGEGITSHEQDRMKGFRLERSSAMLNRHGATLVVVHSFRTATSKKQLDDMWERFALEAYPDMSIQYVNGSVPYMYGETQLLPPEEDTIYECDSEGQRQTSSTSQGTVTHFALANEGSSFGKGYNNAVREAIFDFIRIQRLRTDKSGWTIMNRIMAPLREDGHRGLISKKYIDDARFRKSGRAPQWTVSDALNESDSYRNLCQNRSDVSIKTCTHAFGNVPFARKMTLNWPPDAELSYYVTMRQEDYSSNMQRSDTIQEQVCEVSATGERRVVIQLPGCSTLSVTADSIKQKATVLCGRTQQAFGGVPPRAFAARTEEFEKNARRGEQYLGHRYVDGLLILTFVNGELPLGVEQSDFFWRLCSKVWPSLPLFQIDPHRRVKMFQFVCQAIVSVVGMLVAVCVRRLNQGETCPQNYEARPNSNILQPPDRISVKIITPLTDYVWKMAYKESGGNLARFYPSVVFSYATGGRKGDERNVGPGLYWTAKLQQVLFEAAGVPSFSGLTLSAGRPWKDFMWRLDKKLCPKGSNVAKVLVVLLTEALLKSEACLEEVATACRNNIPLIVLRFDDDCNLRNKWTNLADDDRCRRLVQAIGDKLDSQHIPSAGKFYDAWSDSHLSCFLQSVGNIVGHKFLHERYSTTRASTDGADSGAPVQAQPDSLAAFVPEASAAGFEAGWFRR